jgi:glycosyltransferase involved in cell wall biosynthesis
LHRNDYPFTGSRVLREAPIMNGNPKVLTHYQAKPLRVLNLLGGLTRGGIETWLMHVLRRTDRSRFQLDFFVRGAERGEYENEAEALGSKIGRSLHYLHPLKFEEDLRAFIRENGPYDIVHSHFAEYNGLIMWLASRCGIKVRISHSHNDTRSVDSAAPLHRRAYLNLGRRLVKLHSTHCLAASETAASSQFGTSWKSDPRVQILYCGIDLAPFTQDRKTAQCQLRCDLGFPDGAFIIGHVGRFAAQKNHAFLLKIVALLTREDPAVHLLMVGAGPLQAEVRSLVLQMGLQSRVVLLEPRPDIPRLMLGAMDLFVFPSLHEGLPLAVLEAQAAGLPCIVSEAIPKEASVVPGGIEFLSLGLSAEVWAGKLAQYKASPRSNLRTACLAGSVFDIKVSAARLFEFYTSAHNSKDMTMPKKSADRSRSASDTAATCGMRAPV